MNLSHFDWIILFVEHRFQFQVHGRAVIPCCQWQSLTDSKVTKLDKNGTNRAPWSPTMHLCSSCKERPQSQTVEMLKPPNVAEVYFFLATTSCSKNETIPLARFLTLRIIPGLSKFSRSEGRSILALKRYRHSIIALSIAEHYFCVFVLRFSPSLFAFPCRSSQFCPGSLHISHCIRTASHPTCMWVSCMSTWERTMRKAWKKWYRYFATWNEVWKYVEPNYCPALKSSIWKNTLFRDRNTQPANASKLTKVVLFWLGLVDWGCHTKAYAAPVFTQRVASCGFTWRFVLADWFWGPTMKYDKIHQNTSKYSAKWLDKVA